MQDNIEFIRQSLSTKLPEFNRLRQQARELAAQVVIGRSAFMDQFEVNSELEYKQQAMRDGHIMYHAHVGMNDIDATADALVRIQQELSARDFRLDRAGFAVDRRMGLPFELRDAAEAYRALEAGEAP